MTKTILLVDDDMTSRQLLREILTPEGYAIAEAHDGNEALEVLDRERVDLVITDRAMPGMDGLELLRQLGSRKPPVPALMVSAYGEERMWGEAIGLGAEDYLLKPFKHEDVVSVVRKALTKETP